MINRRRIGNAIPLAGIVAISIFAAPGAHANSFLYSFSTADILHQLQKSQGSSFNSQGYFALFIRPDDPQLSSPYTFGTLTSPKPSGADNWEAVPITNPGNTIPNGAYAQFSKTNGQTSVTLMAGPNGNIFLNGPVHNYSDTGSYPVLFGPTSAHLNSLMGPGDILSFELITNDPKPLYPHFQGYASAIFSFYPNQFQDFLGQGPGKTDFALPFDLVATPEPGTIWLMTFGAALILFGARKRIHLSRNTGDIN